MKIFFRFKDRIIVKVIITSNCLHENNVSNSYLDLKTLIYNFNLSFFNKI